MIHLQIRDFTFIPLQHVLICCLYYSETELVCIQYVYFSSADFPGPGFVCLHVTLCYIIAYIFEHI